MLMPDSNLSKSIVLKTCLSADKCTLYTTAIENDGDNC
jgi:hypothetical protein